MFIGHYSASLVGKTILPKLPFWVLVLAAQVIDIVWAVLTAAGIEYVRYAPELQGYPYDLTFTPYSHSLFAAITWTLATFAILRFIPTIGYSTKTSAVVALVVASHWGLDWLVHRPDLLIYGDTMIGLGLWNFPFIAHSLEFALLLAGVWLVYRQPQIDPREKKGILWFALLLIPIQLIFAAELAPPSLTLLALSALATFLVLAGAAHWLIKRAFQQSPSPAGQNFADVNE